jgi:hypothetical protein
MDIGIERAAKIAVLNDAFRKTVPMSATITGGVYELPDLHGLIQFVREFDCFTEDNDPYGEHDFGSLDWHGEKVFWKIDYYDQELKHGLDPLDLECRRILTVMLASER